MRKAAVLVTIVGLVGVAALGMVAYLGMTVPSHTALK